MDGFLLKNSKGVLGLIIMDDLRPVGRAVYLTAENRLSLTYSDGAGEKLPTPINPEFAIQLRSTSDLFVAHFTRKDLAADPVKEYHVPLSSAVSRVLAARPVRLSDSRPLERLTIKVRR